MLSAILIAALLYITVNTATAVVRPWLLALGGWAVLGLIFYLVVRKRYLASDRLEAVLSDRKESV